MALPVERADLQSLPAQQARALARRQGAAAAAAIRREDVDRRLAAGHGDAHAVGLDRERRPLIGDLERAHARRIADQQVGGAQAHGIERAGDRHAQVLVARPAQVLQRRHEAGSDHPQRGRHARGSRAGASGASRRSPAAASASSASYSPSDTGCEHHLVAGRQQRGRIAAHVPQRHRRARQDVPAARAFQGIDDGHGHGDGDGAARHLDARVLAPRQLELGRQAAEVGQARQEAHHVDVEHRAAVALDDLVPQLSPVRSRDVGQIEAEARVVAGGNAPAPAGALGGFQAISSGARRRFSSACGSWSGS